MTGGTDVTSLPTSADFLLLMGKKAEIEGGATLWARKTIESDIFYKKPDKWFKIWFYLVNRVSHKDTKKYKRGETFLQYDWICEATGASLDQVKKCIAFLKKNEKVSTRRSTRGVWLCIPKYSHYQSLDNYYYNVKAPHEAPERHQSGTREALRYNKNDKNDKNDKNTNSDVPSQRQDTHIVKIIDAFKEVNPSYSKWFGNKTQRAAADRLYKAHGDNVLKVVEILPTTNSKQYHPRITTPVQLEDKWAQLALAVKGTQNGKQRRIY